MKIRPSWLSSFSKKEIEFAFNNARRVVKHAGIHILIAPAQLEYGRILIIIPRKFGNAPARNKVRRQLKAIYYEENLFEKKKDCIAIVKPTDQPLDFIQLKELLLQAFAHENS